MFDFDTFEKVMKEAFKQVKQDQSEALAVEISANFVAGQTAAEKHKSFKSEEPEEDGLTDEEKAEIAALVALYAGYIAEFNDRAQAQILAKAKEIIEAGGSQEDVQQYVRDVFEGIETIEIDNVGKKRKEIYVDENLKLSEVTRTVEKPFYSSVNSYASLMGAIAAHTAYEAGRKTQNIKNKYLDWVFVGPADERARPWHIALIGCVFKYGSIQSSYAEKVLSEPRCRHRAQVYYGDERDTKPEVWEKLKEDAGLFWDTERGEWATR